MTDQWQEILGLASVISMIFGVLVNYMRVSMLNAVHRMLDERFQHYLSSRELELRLKAELAHYVRRDTSHDSQ